MSEQRDPLEEVQACWDEAKEAFGQVYRIMERERRFSDGEHYIDDNEAVDLTRIRPKTEALTRVLNFKVGKVTGGPLYFEARPTDPAPDPNAPDDVALAEAARWLVESNIANPCNRYNAVRYRQAWGGYASRMGVAGIDFYHDVGLHGEVLWTTLPFDSVMWAPGWLDPHDPTCPWLVHVSAVPLQRIRAMRGWKGVKDIQPDDGVAPFRSVGDPGAVDGTTRVGAASAWYGRGGERPTETATIVKLWKRFDPKASYRENEYDALPEELRYMMCGTVAEDGSVTGGCGFKSPTQAEAGDMFPEVSMREMDSLGREVGGCPTCGGNMVRVDGQARGEMVSSYGRGRLIIAAPYSKVVAYNDKWPYRMRSFPYWFFRPALRPHTAFGPSETTGKWSLQALDNASLRMGYEQMDRNRDLTLMPRVGLEDANGNTYDWLTSAGPAFYTGDTLPNSVVHYQGSGLNPAMVAWRNMIRETFREDEGTTDITPETAKQSTATGLEIYAETGNVPLDAQKRIWQEEESMALGLTLDMMLETYTDERMRELRGAEGPVVLALLRQRSANIQVVDQPSLARLDKEKLEALGMWYSMPPPLRKVAARRMNISPADAREVEQAEMEMMAPPPGPDGSGGMGPPPPTTVGNAGGM